LETGALSVFGEGMEKPTLSGPLEELTSITVFKEMKGAQLE
jgi:hypothetical protein